MMSTNNDIPRGFKLRHTLRGHDREINRMAWSPDGRFIASSSFDKTVKIWDMRTGYLVHTLRGHSGAVFCVAWPPDDVRVSWLVSGANDKSIRFWDLALEKTISDLKNHKGAVNDLARSPSKDVLASGSADSSIYFWQPYSW